MGMDVGTSGGGPKSEINVTPFVDVVLVLLIIFMVVAPQMDSEGPPLDLPTTDQAPRREDGGRKILISGGGRCHKLIGGDCLVDGVSHCGTIGGEIETYRFLNGESVAVGLNPVVDSTRIGVEEKELHPLLCQAGDY